MGVYKRIDWNSIIQQVNDLCENPPEDTDCDPLDTLEEIEANHIWMKEDIEQVRDKLTEICDENIFAESLNYWKQTIIDEINEAIAAGWCGCEEECLSDCSNAVSENPVETYCGSYFVEACSANPDPCDWSTGKEECLQAGWRASSALGDWSDLWIEYCSLVEAVEELEHELEVLQNQLAVLETIRDAECAKPPPNNCAAAQADVDAKQEEVDAKQEEIGEKEVERDAKQSEAQTKYDEAESEAADSASLAATNPCACAQHLIEFVNSAPVADYECEQLAPDCIGKDPLRCQVWWLVQRKTHQYWYSGGEFHGSWNTMMGGGYAVSGQPYVTYIFATVSCVPMYACSETGPHACEDGCSSYFEYEYRLLQTFPLTTPEGEVCCD